MDKSTKEWFEGLHSASYLTLYELLNVKNPIQPITKHGYLDKDQYSLYKETGKIDEWCLSVGGALVRIVSNSDMENLIRGYTYEEEVLFHLVKEGLFGERKTETCSVGKLKDFHLYTFLEWEVEENIQNTQLYEEYIPQLLKLSDDPNDIRIVFGFDS